MEKACACSCTVCAPTSRSRRLAGGRAGSTFPRRWLRQRLGSRHGNRSARSVVLNFVGPTSDGSRSGASKYTNPSWCPNFVVHWKAHGRSMPRTFPSPIASCWRPTLACTWPSQETLWLVVRTAKRPKQRCVRLAVVACMAWTSPCIACLRTFSRPRPFPSRSGCSPLTSKPASPTTGSFARLPWWRTLRPEIAACTPGVTMNPNCWRA